MIVEAGRQGRGEVGQRDGCRGVLRALLRSKKDREMCFGTELRPPLGAEGAIAETATKDAAETALSSSRETGPTHHWRLVVIAASIVRFKLGPRPAGGSVLLL